MNVGRAVFGFPAQAGIQKIFRYQHAWTPACAGVTEGHLARSIQGCYAENYLEWLAENDHTIEGGHAGIIGNGVILVSHVALQLG